MKTKRIAPALGLLLLGATACTPQEVALWTAWHRADPQAASTFLVRDLNLSVATAKTPAVRVAVEPETHCYTTPGGTLCAIDGTPEAALYADLQRRLYDGVGVVDPGPGPVVPGYEVAPVDPDPQPANVRCFSLVGGNFCYEEGTADYENAAQAEAEYLAHLNQQELAPFEDRPLP